MRPTGEPGLWPWKWVPAKLPPPLARSRPKTHLLKTFKISKDTPFAEKLEAIVGLYLNPPEHAIVLCVDEKSQIQARIEV